MQKVIIGIHGLGNKPPRELYEQWWKSSIFDGLESIGKPQKNIEFELVYWADILHPIPQNPLEWNRESDYFIGEPYSGRQLKTSYKVSHIPRMLDQLKKQFKKLVYTITSMVNIDLISDSFLKHWFKELDAYYRATYRTPDGLEKPVKHLINDRLVKTLYKHRDKDILIVAHSMGSLVAYDVLTSVSTDIKVHTFVTIGSPMGVPMIINKFAKEHSFGSRYNAATPESVTQAWYNILDENDSITINHRLRDYYKGNSKNITVVDIVVNNQYECKGLRNPHKAFGYLASPEFANIVNNFIGIKAKLGFYEKLRSLWKSMFGKR